MFCSKKIVARILLPFFLVWSVMLPRVAYAAVPTMRVGASFYPMTASGYAALGVDAISLVGRASPWVGVAITGYQVGKLVLDAYRADGSDVKVNVLPYASQQVPTNLPVGWTSVRNSDGTFTVTPPSVVASSVYAYRTSGQSINYPSQQASCNAQMTTISGGYAMYNVLNGGGTICDVYYNYAPYIGQLAGEYTIIPIASCPAGYTLSGSSCNLSNSSLVMYPSDGVPTLKATPSGFIPDSRDPDTSDLPSIQNPQVLTGNDSSGNPIRQTISIAADGSLTLTTEQQTIGADGSTVTYKQTMTFNPQGKVVDSSAATYPGSLSQQGGTNTNPIDTSANLPVDYARTGEAQSAANSINTTLGGKLDTIHNDLNPAGVPTATANPALDSAMTARDLVPDDIAGIPAAPSPVEAPSLFQPFTPAACQPLSWTFSPPHVPAQTVTYNICPKVDTIRNVLSWCLYLITAGLLFQMFTRRPEGGGD